MSRLRASVAVIVGAALLAACGGSSSSSSSSSAAAPAATSATGTSTAAAGPQLTLLHPAVLTVGTELPDPPMVIADTYGQIKDDGYEVEMVKELAKRLGIATVKWVQFPFDGAIAGKPCPCDLYVDGVTIYPDRKQKVDFSSGYFKSNQAALARKGVVVGDLAAAKKLHWGVTKDSSGQFYMSDTVKPDRPASVYNDPTAANLALKAKQVDAVITDVSIAEDLAKKNTSAFIAGQFETGEDYGIVLRKGSPNTAVVTQLVDQLTTEGFFNGLYQKYFPSQSKYPVIK
jgi:polar amino acid transport system substrate-binding protein